MTDKKITQLDSVSSPANADLLETVQNVSTSPVNRKITWTTIKSFLKTHFDTLYLKLTGGDISGGLNVSGNVGIGTTGPVAKLEVESSDIFTTSSTPESGNDSIYLDKNGLTGGEGNYGSSIGFSRLGNNFRKAAIVSKQTGGNPNQVGLSFFVANQGTDNADVIGEVLTILHSGNVGIGTTSPGSKLSVVGLPTSPSGLSAGDIYIDSDVLKIVT